MAKTKNWKILGIAASIFLVVWIILSAMITNSSAKFVDVTANFESHDEVMFDFESPDKKNCEPMKLSKGLHGRYSVVYICTKPIFGFIPDLFP
ncbi:MAG: hypothetical protein KAS32_26420 [Candidatus Peribacteraceae bacterium]|nr:hypothetical protein [Candidatus Peribacteraceae bacterium]